jgi:hypothetical protein
MVGLVWLGKKLASWIAAQELNEYLKGVLVRLDDAVLSVVKDLQQTTVDAIKEANADGKITAEEREQIGAAALASLKAYLGAPGLALLMRVLGLSGGELDAVLKTKLEAAVHDLRKAPPAGGTA